MACNSAEDHCKERRSGIQLAGKFSSHRKSSQSEELALIRVLLNSNVSFLVFLPFGSSWLTHPNKSQRLKSCTFLKVYPISNGEESLYLVG